MLTDNNRVISALSKRYVVVPIRGSDDNGVINPTSLPVAMAFLPQGSQPSGLTTWYAAAWFTVTQASLAPIYKAKVLIGPGGGVVTLTVGSWDVWVKVTHVTETPVEKVDTIRVV